MTSDLVRNFRSNSLSTSASGGKVIDAGDMDVLRPDELFHKPGEGLKGAALQIGFYGRDPPGAPFIGVISMTVLEQKDGAAVHAGRPAEFFQGSGYSLVDVLEGQVDELGGDGRDQILELNPGADGRPDGAQIHRLTRRPTRLRDLIFRCDWHFRAFL